MATGTTAVGTPYATFSATVSGAGTVRWGLANAAATASELTLIVYMHGAGGVSDDFENTNAWRGFREKGVIDPRNRIWVECTGGGVQPWANDASRVAYVIAVLHVLGLFPAITRIILVGRSMGALVTYWLATQSAIAHLVAGVIINSGVSDLDKAYQSGNWTATMQAAYGASDDATFYANSAGHNPMGFDWSAHRDLPILQVVGDADTLVPPADHGLAIRQLIGPKPGVANPLKNRLNGDHSTTNGAYFEVDAMTAFVNRVLEGGPRVTVKTYMASSDGETKPVPAIYANTGGTITLLDSMVKVLPESAL